MRRLHAGAISWVAARAASTGAAAPTPAQRQPWYGEQAPQLLSTAGSQPRESPSAGKARGRCCALRATQPRVSAPAVPQQPPYARRSAKMRQDGAGGHSWLSQWLRAVVAVRTAQHSEVCGPSEPDRAAPEARNHRWKIARDSDGTSTETSIAATCAQTLPWRGGRYEIATLPRSSLRPPARSHAVTHLEVIEVLHGDVHEGLERRLIVLLDGGPRAAAVLQSLQPEALDALRGALCKREWDGAAREDETGQLLASRPTHKQHAAKLVRNESNPAPTHSGQLKRTRTCGTSRVNLAVHDLRTLGVQVRVDVVVLALQRLVLLDVRRVLLGELALELGERLHTLHHLGCQSLDDLACARTGLGGIALQRISRGREDPRHGAPTKAAPRHVHTRKESASTNRSLLVVLAHLCETLALPQHTKEYWLRAGQSTSSQSWARFR